MEEIPCKIIASVVTNLHYLAWPQGKPKLIWFCRNLVGINSR